MSAHRDYDPADPWKVGDRLEYMSGDEPDADLRELDGTTATVLEIGDGTILVESDYGKRWDDPWGFVRRSVDAPTALLSVLRHGRWTRFAVIRGAMKRKGFERNVYRTLRSLVAEGKVEARPRTGDQYGLDEYRSALVRHPSAGEGEQP